jgi:hypothetical protein
MEIPMISTDRLAGIYADVLGWQGLAIENTMYKMGSRQLISTAHRVGMPVIASMNLRYLIRANPIDYKETAIMDLYGNPINSLVEAMTLLISSMENIFGSINTISRAL